jgi:hypothetical protein
MFMDKVTSCKDSCFSDSFMKQIPKDAHLPTAERESLPDEWEIHASWLVCENLCHLQ